MKANIFFLIFWECVTLVALQIFLDAPFTCGLDLGIRAIQTYYYRDLAYAGKTWPPGAEPVFIVADCKDDRPIPMFDDPLTRLIGNRWFLLTCVTEKKDCSLEILNAATETILNGIFDTLLFVAAAIGTGLSVGVYGVVMLFDLVMGKLLGRYFGSPNWAVLTQ